jgi:type III pantothenate kinase
MRPTVVVDVGNTRIKWGLCDAGGIVRIASLGDDPDEWARQFAQWPIHEDPWVMAGVQPQRGGRLREWLLARGRHVVVLDRAAMLPLAVQLDHPDRTGIDRLLNAVAAKSNLSPGRGAVLIDAGSAVTADWLDESHTFQGGCIFPGLDLMAEALHRYTALLPRVTVTLPVPTLPGKSTTPAMQAGLFLAVSGGIREAVRLYGEMAAMTPQVFLTGGQAPLLAEAMQSPASWTVWPEQTLVGILRAAEALP